MGAGTTTLPQPGPHLPTRQPHLGRDGRRHDQPTAGQRPRWHAMVGPAGPGDRHLGRRCQPARRPADTKPAGTPTTPARSADPRHEEQLMIIAATTWPGPSVIQPGIERPTAMRLAQTEHQRVTDAVDALQPEDWTRPTDCTAWDVRQLVAHIAGQANLFSTPLELARQMRGAKARERPGQEGVDALTAFQVEERQHLGSEALRAELHRVGPRGAKGRRRIPGFLRRKRLPGTSCPAAL